MGPTPCRTEHRRVALITLRLSRIMESPEINLLRSDDTEASSTRVAHVGRSDQARNVASSGPDTWVVGRGGKRPGSAPSRQTGPAERWGLSGDMR
jgi:hypothetical protein